MENSIDRSPTYRRSLKFMRILGLSFAMIWVAPTMAAWPDDAPIRIIVPQAPGGTNDLIARLLSAELTKVLNQSVVVENRPGAAGAIGIQAAARAKADGYTLAIASDSAALLDVVNPTVTVKLSRDLQGIAKVGEQPISFAVPSKSAYKSIAELIDDAKRQPGKVAYGTSGVGSSQHIVGEWFARLAGIQLAHVAYKGGGQASADLLGNQIPLAVLGLAPMLAQEKNGGVRILALTTGKRNAAVPNVPTLSEIGFPQIALAQWAGVVAPKDVPAPIVRRLSDEIGKILGQPAVRQKLLDGGVEPRVLGAAEFDRFLKETSEQWAKLVPSLGIKVE